MGTNAFAPCTKKDARLLGRFADEVLARRLKRTFQSVHYRGLKLHMANPSSLVRRWTDAEEALPPRQRQPVEPPQGEAKRGQRLAKIGVALHCQPVQVVFWS